MAFMQPGLIRAVADRANLSEAEADRALSALEDILLEEVLGAVTRRLAGLIQTALGIDLKQMADKELGGRQRAIAARSQGAQRELESV